MRQRFGVLGWIIALLFTFSTLPSSVGAQANGYSTSFNTIITYQNVGNAPANITFTFYPPFGGSGTPISINRTLAANAGTSLNIGSVTELSTFSQGSAIITSDQPVVATVLQVPRSELVRNRPLSNGFSSNEGSNQVLIATVLKNQFNLTTKFSVQNADTSSINVTVKFFTVGSSTPVHTENFTLNVGSARFFDAGTISQLGSQFNGSAKIEATGKVVATAIEGSINSYRVSAFEGISGGSNTVYMPSALCNFGSSQLRTAYAVQNTSDSNSATVTVTYKNLTNAVVATQTATIPAGSKASFETCRATGIPNGFNGSAVISSTGAPIVAIGKASANTTLAPSYGTAFVGVSNGAQKLAAPYVRWTQTRFDTAQGFRLRANIAIQNVGSVSSGPITVKYYDLTGTLIGTHSLASMEPGQKANTNPFLATLAPGQTRDKLDEFGYVGGFGGSATIECANTGCQIVAVVRVSAANSATPGDIVAEDYNAIPIN